MLCWAKRHEARSTSRVNAQTTKYGEKALGGSSAIRTEVQRGSSDGILRVARHSLRAAATPPWRMYDTATIRPGESRTVTTRVLASRWPAARGVNPGLEWPVQVSFPYKLNPTACHFPSSRNSARMKTLAPIDAGGMGEVWRARDTRIDRAVAIKQLKRTRDAL